MKLIRRDDMAPDLIAASDTHTKAEKLDALDGMRRETLAKREDGEMGVSEAQAFLDEIDHAIEIVKQEEEGPGIALGRETSA